MRLLLVAFLILAPVVAHAEGRFALSASRDGVVRLDTATGAVSHCSPVKGVWRCQTLPVEMSRLDALAMEVAALTAKVAALSATVAARPTEQTPAPIAVAGPSAPNFVREALGRFLGLVRTLKHGRNA